MRRLLNERNLTGFAIVTSLFFVVNATGLVLGTSGEGWDYGDAAMAITAMSGPVVALVGLYLTGRLPGVGGALVVAGAISMGAIYFWFPPFWVLGLVVAAIGAIRARRIARQGLVAA